MSYTIKKFHSTLFEEKKSKFYIYIHPVSSVAQAIEFIEKISIENATATHNVYAYSVTEKDGLFVKAFDDGEPKNTAGRPILEILNYHDLSNIVVVISRYFGGIKLGAGGLIRAYAAAAKSVIEGIEKVPVENHVYFMIEFDYMLINTIDNFLATHCITAVEKGFVERVVYKISTTEILKEKLEDIHGVMII